MVNIMKIWLLLFPHSIIELLRDTNRGELNSFLLAYLTTRKKYIHKVAYFLIM